MVEPTSKKVGTEKISETLWKQHHQHCSYLFQGKDGKMYCSYDYEQIRGKKQKTATVHERDDFSQASEGSLIGTVDSDELGEVISKLFFQFFVSSGIRIDLLANDNLTEPRSDDFIAVSRANGTH